jgi:hypothetical protein
MLTKSARATGASCGAGACDTGEGVDSCLCGRGRHESVGAAADLPEERSLRRELTSVTRTMQPCRIGGLGNSSCPATLPRLG